MSADGISARAAGERPAATVRVWDPFVRLFHWSLVGLFVFAYFTGDEWRRAHELAGYVIGGLIALRVAWGLVGSRFARFSSFVRPPAVVASFLAATLRMRAPRHLGHNPAGGAMVVTLMLAIAVIATSGYMMTTDAFWGVEWVEDLHKTAVYATLGLIALHIGGVILAGIEHRENLVLAMITGRKRAPGPADVE